MTSDRQASPHAAERSIRVFVSSTFKDMGVERDELAKRTFPELRARCARMGIAFTEVDLRWGVPDEEAAEGRVLPICLREIERCRPYFIGVLGERYGWIPNSIPHDLIDAQPWIADHSGASVTELEILHGALNCEPVTPGAFFYFRDAVFSDRSRDLRADVASENEDACARLRALKERIRASGLPLVENYPNPAAFGRRVLEDLTVAISTNFRHEPPADPQRQVRDEHLAYARERTLVYVGRPADLDSLDALVDGSGPPIVVIGAPGVGKSALLANWAARYRTQHPAVPLVEHYVGASPWSTEWAVMLRQLGAELSRLTGVTANLLVLDAALQEAFRGALERFASAGRAVVVIDGLNHLDDTNGALDLGWLPRDPLPIRFVLSALPGRALESARRQRWPEIEVAPLDEHERVRLIGEYLGHHGKSLSSARTVRIATSTNASNPLFLRVLLDEMCWWGEYETLDRAIAHYLESETVDDLYERVLARWERDYERDRPHLVEDTMTRVWAARGGLAEYELLEMLGSRGSPLPHAEFSPLLLAASGSLLIRSGRLAFAHDFLRKAVADRYLGAAEKRRRMHAALAEYFSARIKRHPIRDVFAGSAVEDLEVEFAPQLVHELLWQLQQAGDWPRLVSVLTNRSFFVAALRADSSAVLRGWIAIQSNSGYRAVQSYGGPWRNALVYTSSAYHVTMLLEQLGEHDAAEAHRRALRVVGRLFRTRGLQGLTSLDDAVALRNAGNYVEALAVLDRAIREAEREESDHMMALALFNRSWTLCVLSRLDESRIEARRAREAAERAENSSLIVWCLTIEVQVNVQLNDLAQADSLIQRAERVARAADDSQTLSLLMTLRASILRLHGKNEEAAGAQELAEGALAAVTAAEAALDLNDRGALLLDCGNARGALPFFRRAQALYTTAGNAAGVRMARHNLAKALLRSGETEPASMLAMHAESASLFREVGDAVNEGFAVNNQGVALLNLGRFHEALESFERAEELHARADVSDGVDLARRNKAVALDALSR